ncbi:MAG: UDP-N-acetylmuramoyl-tripeptide--D-alanyl-D-alanine ligase [Bryobacteraceae bacterium]|nr:UDP-N-acetylmuramoyl-tripeptide--D-alanyl-D-alanine ligase [Bryobacterales bacterium]MEB2360927.1 UDP-N-acetylmuramoyl-tripeptide--D-alanyl-D-alanine ligase [Bryobacterales bacterium]NUN00326.1 UDP-N-acetylmuramoyl-tripeptide--D-alanyl-D-alanine ligase [Bryobacteraceae bacterium]
MKFSLRQIAGVLRCEKSVPDLALAGWSIDSRTIKAGDLYFALKGARYDGNAFLEDAFASGAAAGVAQIPFEGKPVIVVSETLAALQELARWARREWDGKVVGITGSAGKTTTKDVIAAMLAVERNTGKTAGNLNNHIGLPLSILRLPDEADIAVLEFGMNHAGEIRDLARIAKPDIGVVTNVGYAHIEAFDCLDAVAAAKRELIESLPPDGIAVLNADDPRVRNFGDVHPGPTVTFGLSQDAAVRAEEIEYSAEGVRFRALGCRFETAMAGRHAVLSILAGLAVAGVFGIAPERLQDAVRGLRATTMRGERMQKDGITVWNDCYNSNPDAARAMLDVLKETPASRRIAVLGEMLELGRWSEALHREVGRYVADSGISVLVGIRGAARYMVDEAVRAGLEAGAAYFFEDPGEAGDFVRSMAAEGDAVLFKGSRSVQMEKALERFFG